jgi:hypothetical protein
MKKALLTIALSLGIYSQVQAFGLNILHDTQKKLDFIFEWHLDGGTGISLYHGVNNVQFDWTEHVYNTPGQLDDVQVDFLIYGPLFHEDDFYHNGIEPPIHRGQAGLLYQPYPTNFIGFYALPGAQGAKNKLGNDMMSVRITFFEKDFLPPVPVPEGGATWLLLSLALLPLALFKIRIA